MQPIKLDVLPDRAQLRFTLGDGAAEVSTELSAEGVDNLIRHLAAHRAAMIPVHPAEPPADPARVHTGDNLLWSVRAVPTQLTLEFATQHPGLGWTVMQLSRAQVEDLQTNIDFELLKLPARG